MRKEGTHSLWLYKLKMEERKTINDQTLWSTICLFNIWGIFVIVLHAFWVVQFYLFFFNCMLYLKHCNIQHCMRTTALLDPLIDDEQNLAHELEKKIGLKLFTVKLNIKFRELHLVSGIPQLA